MSTEKNSIELHHTIAGSNGATPGDDFLAAIQEDDGIELAGEPPAPAPAYPEPQQQADTQPDDGDQIPSADGVDTSENGEQGSTQEQQQPAEIALDGLPENIRQSVQAILDEKQRLVEEVAQRERDFRALQGRVGPVQRELDLARQQLSKMQAPATQPQDTAPATAQSLSAVMAQFETPEWKEYERLYPDDAALQKRNQIAIAQAMDDQVKRVRSEFESVAERINRLEQERIAAQRQAELEVLTNAHPDWQEINASDEFWRWFQQREHLFGFRDEAERDARLNNRLFVSDLLDVYKATNRPVSAAAPAQPQAEVRSQSASAALSLAAQPRVSGSGTRRPSGPPSPGDDFMAGFQS